MDTVPTTTGTDKSVACHADNYAGAYAYSPDAHDYSHEPRGFRAYAAYEGAGETYDNGYAYTDRPPPGLGHYDLERAGARGDHASSDEDSDEDDEELSMHSAMEDLDSDADMPSHTAPGPTYDAPVASSASATTTHTAQTYTYTGYTNTNTTDSAPPSAPGSAPSSISRVRLRPPEGANQDFDADLDLDLAPPHAPWVRGGAGVRIAGDTHPYGQGWRHARHFSTPGTSESEAGSVGSGPSVGLGAAHAQEWMSGAERGGDSAQETHMANTNGNGGAKSKEKKTSTWRAIYSHRRASQPADIGRASSSVSNAHEYADGGSLTRSTSVSTTTPENATKAKAHRTWIWGRSSTTSASAATSSATLPGTASPSVEGRGQAHARVGSEDTPGADSGASAGAGSGNPSQSASTHSAGRGLSRSTSATTTTAKDPTKAKPHRTWTWGRASTTASASAAASNATLHGTSAHPRVGSADASGAASGSGDGAAPAALKHRATLVKVRPGTRATQRPRVSSVPARVPDGQGGERAQVAGDVLGINEEQKQAKAKEERERAKENEKQAKEQEKQAKEQERQKKEQGKQKKEQEKRDKEAKEREAKEAKVREREEREKEEKDAREKKIRQSQVREREVAEAKERGRKEKETKEREAREAKEREVKERAMAVKEAKETKEREKRAAKERELRGKEQAKAKVKGKAKDKEKEKGKEKATSSAIARETSKPSATLAAAGSTPVIVLATAAAPATPETATTQTAPNALPTILQSHIYVPAEGQDWPNDIITAAAAIDTNPAQPTPEFASVSRPERAPDSAPALVVIHVPVVTASANASAGLHPEPTPAPPHKPPTRPRANPPPSPSPSPRPTQQRRASAPVSARIERAALSPAPTRMRTRPHAPPTYAVLSQDSFGDNDNDYDVDPTPAIFPGPSTNFVQLARRCPPPPKRAPLGVHLRLPIPLPLPRALRSIPVAPCVVDVFTIDPGMRLAPGLLRALATGAAGSSSNVGLGTAGTGAGVVGGLFPGMRPRGEGSSAGVPAGTARTKNLVLEVEGGGMDVDVYIVPQPVEKARGGTIRRTRGRRESMPAYGASPTTATHALPSAPTSSHTSPAPSESGVGRRAQSEDGPRPVLPHASSTPIHGYDTRPEHRSWGFASASIGSGTIGIVDGRRTTFERSGMSEESWVRAGNARPGSASGSSSGPGLGSGVGLGLGSGVAVLPRSRATSVDGHGSTYTPSASSPLARGARAAETTTATPPPPDLRADRDDPAASVSDITAVGSTGTGTGRNSPHAPTMIELRLKETRNGKTRKGGAGGGGGEMMQEPALVARIHAPHPRPPLHLLLSTVDLIPYTPPAQPSTGHPPPAPGAAPIARPPRRPAEVPHSRSRSAAPLTLSLPRTFRGVLSVHVSGYTGSGSSGGGRAGTSVGAKGSGAGLDAQVTLSAGMRRRAVVLAESAYRRGYFVGPVEEMRAGGKSSGRQGRRRGGETTQSFATREGGASDTAEGDWVKVARAQRRQRRTVEGTTSDAGHEAHPASDADVDTDEERSHGDDAASNNDDEEDEEDEYDDDEENADADAEWAGDRAEVYVACGRVHLQLLGEDEIDPAHAQRGFWGRISGRR